MRSTRHSLRPLILLALAGVCAAAIAVLLASAASGEASELRSGISVQPPAARELGITYGPYLGQRCRHADYTHCDLIGIDVVFARRATRVVAEMGGQWVALRTPGKHNGALDRDWVGNFTHPDLHRHRSIRGTYLIRVPVELHVHFADGRRAHGRFPGVMVSPGWG